MFWYSIYYPTYLLWFYFDKKKTFLLNCVYVYTYQLMTFLQLIVLLSEEANINLNLWFSFQTDQHLRKRNIFSKSGKFYLLKNDFFRLFCVCVGGGGGFTA